ncbi:MEX3C [Cordylochernes scorpioides]|uniref:MEX3C n=1 Tax=Cordylochernes scorpioides TaxID=51811 RepID=A0ABY6KTN7_9ARAC|nr:MEX3C [Cordylochernes scorpioides]
MPASLFPDIENGEVLEMEDERALQLALELTMLGLNSNEPDNYNRNFDSENKTKRSQNTTECVPVPSSEHVAEIVGRQGKLSANSCVDAGCKIKALRAKTNTYIKTPVRGEEPVFVVTGRKEDVLAAKKEILSAAHHFTQIRAQRKNSLSGSVSPWQSSSIPGNVTIYVRVPYRVVGLVVGPKGATIKRIQHQTKTFILTPNRDKEPVFEIVGTPENVESAKHEIESHIAQRTGTILNSDEKSDFNTNGVEFSSGDQLFSSDLNSAFIPYSSDSNNLGIHSPDSFSFPLTSSTSTSGTSKITDFTTTNFNNFGLESDEGIGESPFDSPAVIPTSNTAWSDYGMRNSSDPVTFLNLVSSSFMPRSNSLTNEDTSPLSFLESVPAADDHPPARRINSDPLLKMNGLTPLVSMADDEVGITNLLQAFPPLSSSNSDSLSSGSSESLTSQRKKMCFVCTDSEVVAALVPCGHNLFCMECANCVVTKEESVCPVCYMPVSQAVRIYQ